ncbi:hypothetical protein TNCV_2542271 [Trichonephila clavipes]|nr:hypothetical protein TNCV_2542271 [Trichonephila clavipes]
MIGLAENPDMTAHIMKDPPPCLTVGRSLNHIHTLVQVSSQHAPTRPVLRKNAKDNSSDLIPFFHLSVEQTLQSASIPIGLFHRTFPSIHYMLCRACLAALCVCSHDFSRPQETPKRWDVSIKLAPVGRALTI